MSEPQQHPPQGPQPPAQPQGHPPQGYPAQGYPAQGYSSAPHGYAAAPPTPRASGAALGRIAFLTALVALGIRLLSSVIAPFLYTGDYYGVVMGINGVVGFIVFLGNAGALAVGIIALRRSGPRLLAAIAVGIAGSAFVGYLATLLSSAFAWVAY